MKNGHLFQRIPAELPEEISESLLTAGNVRIERIVSKGHRSPPDFWYEQQQNEWVVLLKGEAGLRFEQDAQAIHLMPGMYVNIPAHARHRVEWTSASEETVWLAVFY
ncbi:cupin domain-containing protein [Herminiimonas sp. NPDC097707]|uniref:cupin domain-containing protein n=1 Tax=Herminiimonas sp. NPDC097707 TaxID=3364007 RepID=UPI00383BCCB4